MCGGCGGESSLNLWLSPGLTESLGCVGPFICTVGTAAVLTTGWLMLTPMWLHVGIGAVGLLESSALTDVHTCSF